MKNVTVDVCLKASKIADFVLGQRETKVTKANSLSDSETYLPDNPNALKSLRAEAGAWRLCIGCVR